jgi:hypothetical protein
MQHNLNLHHNMIESLIYENRAAMAKSLPSYRHLSQKTPLCSYENKKGKSISSESPFIIVFSIEYREFFRI